MFGVKDRLECFNFKNLRVLRKVNHRKHDYNHLKNQVIKIWEKKKESKYKLLTTGKLKAHLNYFIKRNNKWHCVKIIIEENKVIFFQLKI